LRSILHLRRRWGNTSCASRWWREHTRRVDLFVGNSKKETPQSGVSHWRIIFIFICYWSHHIQWKFPI